MIKSKGITWAGHVARMGKMNAYRALLEKSGGKRPGRTKCRWEKIEWDGKKLIPLAQDRDQWSALMNTVMFLRVP
jgi:hypothetical protein